MDTGDQSAIYGLKFQARCLRAQVGDTEHDRFLVGTQSLRDENEVHLIQYEEDANEITAERTYSHPSEIWDLSPCPTRPEWLFTVSNNPAGSSRATLFVMPDVVPGAAGGSSGRSGAHAADDGALSSMDQLTLDFEARPLQELCTLGAGSGQESGSVAEHARDILQVLWPPHPTATGRAPAASNSHSDAVVAIHESSVCVWDLEYSAAPVASAVQGTNTAPSASVPAFKPSLKPSKVISPPSKRKQAVGCWNPHHANIVATASGTQVSTWDVRQGTTGAQNIPHAHAMCVRDIDYNPNKPHVMATSGDDTAVRFWDLRRADTPLKTLKGTHSHWAWCVKYNQHHDQLVLSAGTDYLVCLWSLPSISSAPLDVLAGDHAGGAGGGGGGGTGAAKDSLVKKFEDHEESVYSVAWSASNPWIFASLSYDGRVVVSQVPQEEKYRILL